MYGDYKYTYWACGIVLIIAGTYLFIGMGINYRLVAKEEKAKKERMEDETNMDEAGKKKEEKTDAASSPQKNVKEQESRM